MKGKIKRCNVIERCLTLDIEDIKKKHNSNWPKIPDHPYRILTIGGSGFGKKNALLHLMNHKLNIDKIYLYAEDSYEAKYQ